MVRSKILLSDAFSLVVRKQREAKGLSKAGLAEAAGLHQTHIGLLERGGRTPNLDTASAIAAALEVPLSNLIGEAKRLIAKAGQKQQLGS